MNTSQILDSWKETMGNPTEETLGRLSAMYSIGSIASLPVVPFLSDRYGRKIPITVGCIIMVIAAAIQVRAHWCLRGGSRLPATPLSHISG